MDMKASNYKPLHGLHATSSREMAECCPLLALPVQVLHHILSTLGPEHLLALLQTSKAMAQEVMQHSSGRLSLLLAVKYNVDFAATRQLLQLAPPACLKLHLRGHYWVSSSWKSLSSLFKVPLSTANRQNCQRMSHFSCIREVCIRDIDLPGVVPAELAVACPDMQTLQLHSCHFKIRPQASHSCSSEGLSTSSRDVGGITGVWPAANLHTLLLAHCYTPDPPLTSMQSAQYVGQLKSSMPNVTCLKMPLSDPDVLEDKLILSLLSALGPQLKELHVQNMDLRYLKNTLVAMQPQLLQMLILPDSMVESEVGIVLLLSLRSLTHVELDSADQIEVDFSSHPCKWQCLHLHGPTICIQALAKLPLHSLTYPLVLGEKGQAAIQLQLPSSPGPEGLAGLQRLTRQLMKCEVQLQSSVLAWSSDIFTDDEAPPQGQLLSPALQVVAPAFGPQVEVHLKDVVVDRPIMEVLAAVYHDSLQHLTIQFCYLEADMLPVWRAALSGLPVLHTLHLKQCLEQDPGEVVVAIKCFAEAMAQQPAGRRMMLIATGNGTSEAVDVMAAVSSELEGVDVTAQPLATCPVRNCDTVSWMIKTTDREQPHDN